MKPHATNLALCLVTSPFSSFLSLNTHFNEIGRWTVASGQVDELPCPILLHGLELLLHGGLPRWFALGFRIVDWLTGVREVELGEETRSQAWREPVADDVGHRAVAEWLVIVERVELIFIVL
jgi:hypothetical protein